MASHKENMDFAKEVLPQYLLDDAVEWIKANMEPEDVFDDDKLKDWATDWASNNDYVFAPDTEA